MNRSWMYGDRRERAYLNGVLDFCESALEHRRVVGVQTIYCPCRDCHNVKRWTDIKVIEDHLFRRGFTEDYEVWCWHGETLISRNNNEQNENEPIYEEMQDEDGDFDCHQEVQHDVIEFLRGACANVSLIHVYIMFLIENYLSLFQISRIKFLCPQRICDAEIRRDFVAPSLYVKHAFMGEANKEQMTKFVLAPYLQENHWVLLVVDIKRGEAYEFDPLAVKPFKNCRWLNCNNVLSNSYKFYRASLKGPPLSKGRRELTFLPMECAQQTGGTECGYYVMRYMYEIVTKHNECKGNLQEEYIGRTKAYNSEEIDEVREQWAKFFRNKFLLE